MALCSNCGREMGAGVYCGGCGQRTGGGGSAPQSAPSYGQQQAIPPQFGQPQYAPPQYGAPQFAAHPSQKTNGMAIASLVMSLVCCNLLGVIFGHVALNQINRTGEGGRGLALAGLIIGYVSLAIGAIWLLVVVAAAGSSGY